MHKYLRPEPDGLRVRESGTWVAEKLDYLKRYIDVFETAMRSKWRARAYIDLFAGSGKCQLPGGSVLLGSPLLALTTKYPFTQYYFVDCDGESISALRQRCSVHRHHDLVELVCDDANKAVQEIVESVKRAGPGQSSLNLAFLDPEGLELTWRMVASLASVPRMDLIIHYSQIGLNRYMPIALKEEEETIVDRFFGGTDWRRIYANGLRGESRFMERELIHHYKERLELLGYQQVRLDEETGYAPLIRNAQKNAPLYRLLFASKHPLGHEFWSKITQKNVHGQARLPHF